MRQQELEAKEAAGHQAWVTHKYRKAKRQNLKKAEFILTMKNKARFFGFQQQV